MLDFNPKSSPAKESPETEFLKAMSGHSLEPGQLIPDGGLNRFDIEKRGDKAGWYVFYADGNCPAGSFGNWKTGLKKTWSYKDQASMDPEELDTFRRHVAEMKEKRKAEEQRRHAEAKKRAETIWSKAGPAPQDNPYLIAKGVKSYGLKIEQQGRLIVPLFDMFNDLYSLQFIGPDSKRFLPGGAISGNYFTIPGNDKIFICEGYATGATVHEATGGTVIIAFNAGNLKPVALNIKSKFPSSQIFICADNDRWTKTEDGRENPGVIYGTEAAGTIGAKLLIPGFKDLEEKPTDFNDLARLEGVDAVRVQIQGAPKRFNLADWNIGAYQGEAPERKWLVKNTFPMASVSILAAMGDAGKGMISIHLALNVAADPAPVIDFGNGTESFGNPVEESGAVVIFSAEDDKDEIHRRLEQIDKDGRRFGKHCKKRLIIVPLPNAGGPIPLVTPGKSGPEASPIFHEIKDQLIGINDLKLVVFDPMASFVAADINADPAAGAFTTGLLSSLATETGACIIVAHHMNKGNSDRAIKSPEQARNMIRGTTAIVDGVRAAYVLWPMATGRAKYQCDLLKTPYARNKVFCGALVKSNGPGDRDIKTYVRDEGGLLVVSDKVLAAVKLTPDQIKETLLMDIQDAANAGRPFTMTGRPGLYERREELSVHIKSVGKNRLPKIAQELLDDGELLKCVASGSKIPQWLDIPGGPFDSATGGFELGGRKKGRNE